MAELSTKQVERFRRDGHLVVDDVVSDVQVTRLRAAFEAQAAQWAAEIATTVEEYLSIVSQWMNVWERNTAFAEQLRDPRAAAIAAELLDCDRVRVFHDHLIAKPPHGGATIPWHRDLPNWPVAEARAVSCWLALDDAPIEAGALWFMPGAHTEPITRSIDFLSEQKAWGSREADAVAVPVRAGSTIFHHCLSWHTSPPNRSSRWRRAYITVYLDATCTFDPSRARWHPMTGRVTVAPGAVFNEDAFPVLGGRRPR
ncbi:MAG: phytanoyl-CoA dioxygenase family protein [Sandaracinaceae bacterium]|nr:phytanoyl-CoA dioxygenase family protein [Sandaracinaceae bacterium]